MDYKTIHSVYFVGIGGIGMSALARFFHQQGASVGGYDRTRTRLTQTLEREGILIHYDEDPKKVREDADVYVYTPAIPQDHPVMAKIRAKGWPLYKRAEVLGLLSRHFKTIAVAGTHGKTTVSSMITHLMREARIKVNAFIGGIAVNLGSNFVFDPDAEWLVVEADEYDRSFLHLHPDIAVVTAVDADHLDIYGSAESLINSFEEFLRQIRPQGQLLMHRRLTLQCPDHVLCQTYGIGDTADFRAGQPDVWQRQMRFSFYFHNTQLDDLRMSLPGGYNVENALAAFAVALKAGASVQALQKGLLSFRGVERRFDIKVNREEAVYVDDYAHHPEELKAVITAAKAFFPGKKLVAVFQPHLYSRTRDFADEFAKSLELLDELILLDIYPAREKPVPGVSSFMLAQRMQHTPVKVLSKQQVLTYVREKKPSLFMTLGAGDIDELVDPILQMMKKQ
ncbi:MAG: UDP-N-acetylmuramate--L-alanine ligase [Bacteroidales bacterium]